MQEHVHFLPIIFFLDMPVHAYPLLYPMISKSARSPK